MTVFVTSATAGFGTAAARRFVQEGHHVIAADYHQDRLGALETELGDAVLPFVLDVLDADAIVTSPGSLPEGWREVDILANSAGPALDLEPAQHADLTDQNRTTNTNCSELVHMTRALFPAMVECNHGHIINIGSIVGTYLYLGSNVYGATKAFVHQSSLNLQADLTGTRVRASNVESELCFGMEFSNACFEGDDVRMGKVYEGTGALTANSITETVYQMVALSAHFNVDVTGLMPAYQSFSATNATRDMA